jgi:capsid protein
MWYREYSLLQAENNYRTPRHTWFWDGFTHVDPTKEANAQQIRLLNNTTTLAAECAKDGKDYMTVLRQRAKEIKIMHELGIPIPGETSITQETKEQENIEDE